MESTSFPIRYSLDIILTLSHTCLIGVLVLSFETYFVQDSLSWGVNNCRASARVRLKDMSVSALGHPPLWTFLSRARLALNISRHSSSNHGLDFFGTVVALGMLSFAALMRSSTKSVRGVLVLEDMSCNLSIHDSANRSQSAFENTRWLESPPWSASAEVGGTDIQTG